MSGFLHSLSGLVHHKEGEPKPGEEVPQDGQPHAHHHLSGKALLGLGAVAAVGVAAVGVAAVGATAVGVYGAHKVYESHEANVQNKSPVKVHLHIISAAELTAADSGGTSDPFVVVTQGHISEKTKVIPKELFPTWNEEFVFGVLHQDVEKGHELHFKVYDKDTLSNDSLGEVKLPLNQLPYGQPKEFHLHLVGGIHKDKQHGVLKIAANLEHHPEAQGADGRGVDVQGYPQAGQGQGYPPQGYPPQGYPPQGYQAYPSQGYPPQGYPPQGYQGYPPQGYPPQGYPPQGYQSGGYPPQGYPPQGY